MTLNNDRVMKKGIPASRGKSLSGREDGSIQGPGGTLNTTELKNSGWLRQGKNEMKGLDPGLI